MQLLKFIDKETSESYYPILFMATISGIANAILLAVVNHASYAVAHNEDLTRYFLIYLIAFALLVLPELGFLMCCASSKNIAEK